MGKFIKDEETYLKNEFYEPDLFDAGAGDSASTDDIEYYVSSIKEAESKIVDIGAGTGRLTIPLIEKGFQVTAIEPSQSMIKTLASKVNHLDAAAQKRFNLISGNFCDNKENEKYNYLIACDDFLTHYLTMENLNLFFKNACTWLEEGGIFLTDTRQRDVIRLEKASVGGAKAVNTFGITWGVGRGNADGIATYFWDEYDEKLRVIKTTNCYHEIDSFGKVNNIYYRIIEQRLHTYDEITNIAGKHGFSLISANKRFKNERVSDVFDGVSFAFERNG